VHAVGRVGCRILENNPHNLLIIWSTTGQITRSSNIFGNLLLTMKSCLSISAIARHNGLWHAAHIFGIILQMIAIAMNFNAYTSFAASGPPDLQFHPRQRREVPTAPPPGLDPGSSYFSDSNSDVNKMIDAWNHDRAAIDQHSVATSHAMRAGVLVSLFAFD
jgi:hypothetical protein